MTKQEEIRLKFIQYLKDNFQEKEDVCEFVADTFLHYLQTQGAALKVSGDESLETLVFAEECRVMPLTEVKE